MSKCHSCGHDIDLIAALKSLSESPSVGQHWATVLREAVAEISTLRVKTAPKAPKKSKRR